MPSESATSDIYAAVLADLKAKRAQLDTTIATLEAIVGGALLPGIAPPPASAESQQPVSEGPGWLLGMTIPEAAKKLLASRRQPMRNPDIAAAFKSGGLAMNSADPVNTIGSVLTRRFNEVGDVVKVGRGTWGLKEWYPGRSFKREKGESGDSKPEPVNAASE